MAWGGLGWAPVALSEIDPLARAVLSQRLPDVPLHGDMTSVDWGRYQGQVDVVIAGAPCQAFSLAGTRQSLLDSRGALTIETIRALNAIRPSYFLFENVPGILSARDNAFGHFLAGLVGAGTPLKPPGRCRWTDAGLVSGPDRRAAWRLLDAQHFGVPQRRRRVYLVGCPLNGTDPAKILFERRGLRGNPESKRKAREKITCDSVGRFTSTGRKTITINAREDPIYISDKSLPLGRIDRGHSFIDFTAAEPSVRRLTPVECERLQGFPDGWTQVQFRGKPTADEPRYKMLGNAMAVPVLEWIGERMEFAQVHAEQYLLS